MLHIIASIPVGLMVLMMILMALKLIRKHTVSNQTEALAAVGNMIAGTMLLGFALIAMVMFIKL